MSNESKLRVALSALMSEALGVRCGVARSVDDAVEIIGVEL